MIILDFLPTELLARICKMQFLNFGVSGVPEPIYRSWLEASPRSFFYLYRDVDIKALCGQITLLGLRKEPLNLFLSGQLDEHSFRPSHFTDIEDEVFGYYLESVIIEPEARPEVRRMVPSLLSQCLLKRSSRKARGIVYALAATDAGAGYLVRNGFEKHSNTQLASGGVSCDLWKISARRVIGSSLNGVKIRRRPC
jgi:hypothetical protein